MPASLKAVDIGATLGVVIGTVALPRAPERALDQSQVTPSSIDWSEPHADVVEPAIRQRCRDGFCAIGPWVIARDEVSVPDALAVRYLRQCECVRSTRRAPPSASVRRATDRRHHRVHDADGRGRAAHRNRVAAGAGSRRRSRTGDDRTASDLSRTCSSPSRAREAGRVAWMGAVHDAVEAAGRVTRRWSQASRKNEVVWLPPLPPDRAPAHVFAVSTQLRRSCEGTHGQGAGRSRSFILKGIEFAGRSSRSDAAPADVTYMHHECELAVVIGRSARRVTRADAYDYVGGLHRRQRLCDTRLPGELLSPQFPRQKSRRRTPIGPWLVDAGDVRNPMNLRLTTSVNGAIMQRSSTADMVFDVAFLIAHLSAFMTLSPGDVILTGAARGVAGRARRR